MGVSICGFKLVPWYFVQELKIKTTFQCLNWIIEQQESAAAKLSFKWSRRGIWSTDSKVRAILYSAINRAQLFEGRLALNPGLNLTRVSFSCVQKHFLG